MLLYLITRLSAHGCNVPQLITCMRVQDENITFFSEYCIENMDSPLNRETLKQVGLSNVGPFFTINLTENKPNVIIH